VKLRRIPLLFAATLALAAALAAAQDKGTAPPAIYGIVDQGTYRVSLGGRPLGYEVFTFTIHYDSLYIFSEYRQPLRGDTLRKSQVLAVRHFDNDVFYYGSTIRVPGQRDRTHGLSLGDTVVTTYQESGGGGEGITHVRPAGRLFVIESNAYALFDLLFRDLALRKDWERRPVNLVALGDQDTVLQATARSLGSDTLRWGNAPVTARKYSVSDGRTVFNAWVGPQGAMLKLEQPAAGLVVVRDPPPARRVGRPSSSPKN